MRLSAEDAAAVAGFVIFLASVIAASWYTGQYAVGFAIFGVVFVIFAISLLSGALYFPSDKAVVRRMVGMARLKDGDMAYDLGSGDGRILVEAARRNGRVRLTGVEVNPFVAVLSKLYITLLRLGKRIDVRIGDLFKTDLRKADVIFVFLMQDANYRLEGKLRKELRKNSRIVTHIWKFKDLKLVESDDRLKVYMYKV
jgi:SAM-dependent methyltransferase